jgi:hypothetical protein
LGEAGVVWCETVCLSGPCVTIGRIDDGDGGPSPSCSSCVVQPPTAYCILPPSTFHLRPPSTAVASQPATTVLYCSRPHQRAIAAGAAGSRHAMMLQSRHSALGRPQRSLSAGCQRLWSAAHRRPLLQSHIACWQQRSRLQATGTESGQSVEDRKIKTTMADLDAILGIKEEDTSAAANVRPAARGVVARWARPGPCTPALQRLRFGHPSHLMGCATTGAPKPLDRPSSPSTCLPPPLSPASPPAAEQRGTHAQRGCQQRGAGRAEEDVAERPQQGHRAEAGCL